MTEDNRTTPTTTTHQRAPHHYLCEALQHMHGIHPQVVPHSLTGFTASRMDPPGRTPWCAWWFDSVVLLSFFDFQVGRFDRCAISIVGYCLFKRVNVSRGSWVGDGRGGDVVRAVVVLFVGGWRGGLGRRWLLMPKGISPDGLEPTPRGAPNSRLDPNPQASQQEDNMTWIKDVKSFRWRMAGSTRWMNRTGFAGETRVVVNRKGGSPTAPAMMWPASNITGLAAKRPCHDLRGSYRASTRLICWLHKCW